MGKFKDLTGKKFGRLQVVKRSKNMGRTIMWGCLCICGKKKDNNGINLQSGRVKSCGCLRSEVNSILFKTHGMGSTHFYRIWADMKTRITNNKTKHYKNYGGRGIKIIWDSFESFKKDMYRKYLYHVKKYGQSNTTIERNDVDGNYSKENCKFIVKTEQAKNRHNTIYIIFKNKRQSLANWSRELKIPYETLYHRFKKKIPINLILK